MLDGLAVLVHDLVFLDEDAALAQRALGHRAGPAANGVPRPREAARYASRYS